MIVLVVLVLAAALALLHSSWTPALRAPAPLGRKPATGLIRPLVPVPSPVPSPVPVPVPGPAPAVPGPAKGLAPADPLRPLQCVSWGPCPPGKKCFGRVCTRYAPVPIPAGGTCDERARYVCTDRTARCGNKIRAFVSACRMQTGL